MSQENNFSTITESANSYKELMDKVDTITNPFSEDSDIKRSNANINGLTVQGKLQQVANETSKIYAIKKLLPKRFSKAHIDGDIHIHDLDYYLTKTTTCLQIDLGEMLRNGIWNEHGFIRPPRSIQTAGYIAAVVLQSHQNQQHGGQSFPSFDFDLAPYVKISYEKNLAKLDEFAYELNYDTEERGMEFLEKKAWEMTEKDTLQAMEGFVHNINTMHSRGGGQIVFASVNFGLDTSREGRLVSKCLMQAQMNGLGKGETPIFPILVFKVKDGINGNPGDPNYDLLEMSIDVTSKRLFPNWIFEDAPMNLACYDPEHPENAIATMGCRTRLATSCFPESNNTSTKRGNASFTTINLPRLGILANGDLDKFYELLDDRLQLVHDQLYERFLYQGSATPEEFKYMFKNNTPAGKEWLETEDAKDYIKHFSLSIGFIGLAECLKALIGEHHGESEKAQELGLAIVKRMREFCDTKVKEDNLNWSLLATPAEGLAGRFTAMDRERFGTIDGVTDKEFYTNSSHIPVDFDSDIFDKLDKEAPYHALENAGHIAYIELDSDPSQNPEALMKIVQYMKRSGIGYGAINHPVDKCNDCGFEGVGIWECPQCKSKNILMLRRITGYLVGDLKRWNNGKKAEEAARVKHHFRRNQ